MSFDVVFIQKLILASANRRIQGIEDQMTALHYLGIINSGSKEAGSKARNYYKKATKKISLEEDKKKGNFTEFLKLHTNNDIFKSR